MPEITAPKEFVIYVDDLAKAGVERVIIEVTKGKKNVKRNVA
jgi:uncharacterized protein YbcV (DUF1398 family)